MSVYLGNEGEVELQRVETGRGLRSELAPSDVNVGRKRFSVDFALGALITGDLITIAVETGQTLELVSGHSYPDWTGYVHVDEVGGIRLYSTFAFALAGGISNALALVAPSVTRAIKITTRTDLFKCVAQVKSFDMTTSRDLVQTTSLSQEFQSQYEAGLISGQGRMSCFWEHQTGTSETLEFSVYLARLVLRLQQGARFRGKFYIYKNEQENSSVWYECDCIVSSVQVSVEPTEAITTEVDFVTTGLITLRQDSSLTYILQEDANKILLESNQSGALLQEESE
jgi:hypothetical protein